MAKKAESKYRTVPATRFPASSGPPKGPGDWVWMHLHGEWRDVTGKPKERVRQEFILHLHNDYGYSFEQMDQERRTMHGRMSPRADIVIWETPAAKSRNRTPVLVVECKAEKVDINIKDYCQGESYARAVGCEFFIAHNARYTSVTPASRICATASGSHTAPTITSSSPARLVASIAVITSWVAPEPQLSA